MATKNKKTADSFFEELGNASELLRLFEHLPDIHFFAKDADGNIMAANRHFARRMGVETAEELIGKSTEEICPPELAKMYADDDRRVMQTGKSMVDVVELNQAADGSVNWFVTCKIPLHRKDGSVAGVAGTARDIKQAKVAFAPYDRFAAVFDHIAEHCGEPIPVSALAKLAGMSVSCFERHFKRLFGLSPSQHIIRFRIKKACRELASTTKSITEIAVETGFYDQSAMTRHFSRLMNTTPRAYRKLRERA